MNSETFLARMLEEGWKETEPVDMTTAMVNWSDDLPHPETMKTPDFVMQRGNFLIYIYDGAVEKLRDEDFETYFAEITTGYYFFNDWEKKFKGSEFLKPVVEKELYERKIHQMNQFYTKLKMIEAGHYTLKQVIDEFDAALNLDAAQRKANKTTTTPPPQAI